MTTVLTFVVANTGRDAGGDFRCGNLHDAVAEFLAFAARNGNAHKRKENAVSAKHLTEFLFVDVERADFVIVHNRTETWATEAHFGMRILLL